MSWWSCCDHKGRYHCWRAGRPNDGSECRRKQAKQKGAKGKNKAKQRALTLVVRVCNPSGQADESVDQRPQADSSFTPRRERQTERETDRGIDGVASVAQLKRPKGSGPKLARSPLLLLLLLLLSSGKADKAKGGRQAELARGRR